MAAMGRNRLGGADIWHETVLLTTTALVLACVRQDRHGNIPPNFRHR